MPVDWLDPARVSFNALLLLEAEQIAWLPGWDLPRRALALALRANPAVEWFLRHKQPAAAGWLDEVLAAAPADPQARPAPDAVRAAEVAVLGRMVDLLVYALDPARYDAQPFLGWNTHELTGLVDFAGRTVIDVGSGTGRLALAAAAAGAALVYAVDPVANLRAYVRRQAAARGFERLYAVDGLITRLPFPAGFADITLGGHVFGDDPPAEHAEMMRVTRPGGWVILCPGNDDADNDRHAFLVDHGYAWARFEEPGEGLKRKYWRQAPGR